MKNITNGAVDGQRGNWYVLITKYAQEKRAQENLVNQGVNCWLPRITVHSVDARGDGTGSEVLAFPRYLFAHFDTEIIHTTTIKATRGVSGIVSFNNTPAVMNGAELAALRMRMDAGASLTGRAPDPEHGETVTIENGAFDGLEAIWHQPDGAKRAILLINLFGRLTEAKIRSEMRFRRQLRQVSQPCHAV